MSIIYTPPLIDPNNPNKLLDPFDTDKLKGSDIVKSFVHNIYYPRTITMPMYENLNYNTNIQKRVINYFYYKTLEKWLYDDRKMTKILHFFKIDKDKVLFISSINEFKKAKNNVLREHEKKIIVDFISKYILTKSKMGQFIYKFIKKSNIPWINLYKNQRLIKKFIRKRLFRKLAKSLS